MAFVPRGSRKGSAIRYPARLLGEHEDILLMSRPHWRVLFPALIWAMVIAAVAGGTLAAVGPHHLVVIGSVAAVLWVLVAGRRVVRWRAARHILTTERVIVRTGVLSRSGTDLSLASIEHVRYHQRLRDRVLGSGDLALRTSGEGAGLSIRDVRRPAALQSLIARACDLQRTPDAAPDLDAAPGG